VAAPDALHTIDFAPYEPSHGELASFVSTGVKTAEGIVFGVVALQVPFGVTVKLDSTGDRIESCADGFNLLVAQPVGHRQDSLLCRYNVFNLVGQADGNVASVPVAVYDMITRTYAGEGWLAPETLAKDYPSCSMHAFL
jgi:hypothetical protein